MAKKARKAIPKHVSKHRASVAKVAKRIANRNAKVALKKLAQARQKGHYGRKGNGHKVTGSRIAKMVAAPVGNTIKIDEIVKNDVFSDYISRNVGKRALEIIDVLNADAQTDDKLAAKLNIKVNEVRRMLNILNGYSIARYDINKDNKGWLTFKWYIDRAKLAEFGSKLEANVGSNYKLPEGVNDFFYCENCYKDNKVILPFDAAFENSFRCECGKSLKQLDRDQVKAIFEERGL